MDQIGYIRVFVSSGVAKKCVGADLDVNHCEVYRRRCSLWQRGQPAVYVG
jgi:hypothetical protein